MLTLTQRIAPPAKNTEPIGVLPLPFDLRCRSRLLATLQEGTPCRLQLPRGVLLHDGDWLMSEDGQKVLVVALPEELLEATTSDAVLLARAAYHLGNRHVAVDLAPNRLRIAQDSVLEEMLRALGLEVQHITAPFDPEAGAYGDHAHLDHHHQPQAKIHEAHDLPHSHK